MRNADVLSSSGKKQGGTEERRQAEIGRGCYQLSGSAPLVLFVDIG
jgi:hypothetical protein